MDELSIRKLLRHDSSFVKRRLRTENTVTAFAMALWLEVHKQRPRKRLIVWLCQRIPAFSK
jgi:hypothetical protein